MSIFVTGGTWFIYTDFVLDWTYRGDDFAINIQWPIQDKFALSTIDQQTKFLAEAGRFA